MLLRLVLDFICLCDVCRKLAELGFKKSAEKCKEKFEDESRYFNNINYGKNYRFLSELEELYQGDNQNPDDDHIVAEKTHHQLENPSDGGGDMMGHALEEDSRNVDKSVSKQCEESDKIAEKSRDPKRKRKRRGRFEMFKGFCESIVNKMMAQQEEIHNKLLEDMMKRDEEKFAREEAWKKQEMDRMNKELEMMAQEQAIAGDRQATIIEFLKKYAASSPESHNFGGGNGKHKTKDPNRNGRTSSLPLIHSQNPNTSSGENNLEPTPSSNVIPCRQTTCSSPARSNSGLYAIPAENPSSSDTLLQVPSSSTNSSPAPYNPSSSLNSQDNPPDKSNSVSKYKPSSTNLPITEKEDVGRRWPRDEVLALINLRCTNLKYNTEDKEGNKAPLWERISQGMSELGFKRSAKRCKEKWENINKYFRKTKDVNKKRSLDSRTCPYFHQLRSLYSQGKLVPQSERSETHLNPTANSGQVPLDVDEAQAESSQVGSGGFSVHVDSGGEKTSMQVPPLNFD